MAVSGWHGCTSDVSVAASGWTTIETINIREGAQNLWAEFSNANVSDLDQFEVAVRPYKGTNNSASFHVIADAAEDFTTGIKEPIRGCSADLTSMAKNTTALLWMEVKGLSQVRFRASASGGATIVGIKWSVR